MTMLRTRLERLEAITPQDEESIEDREAKLNAMAECLEAAGPGQPKTSEEEETARRELAVELRRVRSTS